MRYLAKFQPGYPVGVPIVQTDEFKPRFQAKLVPVGKTGPFVRVEQSGFRKGFLDIRLVEPRSASGGGTQSWARQLRVPATRAGIQSVLREIQHEDAAALAAQDEKITAANDALRALRKERERMVTAAFKRATPVPWLEVIDEAEAQAG